MVFLFIESDAVVVRDLALAALPDGDHAVDGLVFGDHAVVILGLALVVGLAGLEALLVLDVHLDGPAHIVGVFLHQGLQLPDLQIGAVDLLLGVGLDVHDHVGAGIFPLTGGDGVAVSAAALPLHALVAAVFAADDGDLVRHHEGGVEAHAELADDGDVLPGLFLVHFVLELERAALGDDAQVVFGLLHGHADAVIPDGDGARFLVDDDVDLVI